VVKIDKRQARKFFKQGQEIYMLPSRMNLRSVWYKPYKLMNSIDFDKQVNAYEYYNCNSETGSRAKFYRAG